jgi:hypothetical protein
LLVIGATIYVWPRSGPIDDPVGDGFCFVPLPAAWQSALTAGTVHSDDGADVDVVATSSDGRSIFVQSAGRSGHEVDWLHDGERTTVLSLPAVGSRIVEATFDGRWLALEVFDTHWTPASSTPGGFYAWDSQTRGPARPLQLPAYSGRWVAGPGRIFFGTATVDTPVDLEMLDLVSGQISTIGHGLPSDPAPYGSLLVWPVAEGPFPISRPLTMAAADIATGNPAEVPDELKGLLHRDTSFVGDGQTLVAVAGEDVDQNDLTHDGQYTTFAWHAGVGTRITVGDWRLADDDFQVGGPWVGYRTESGLYIFDLRSHSYAQISSQPGGFMLSPDALVLKSESVADGRSTTIGSTLIRPSQLLPLPGCPTA